MGHGHHGHGGFKPETEWIALFIASIAGLILNYTGYRDPAGVLLATIGTLLLARFIVMGRKGKFTVDIVMGGVAWILYVAGRYPEGFIIMAIYGLAETIEEAAEYLATGRLSKLVKLLPSKVTVERAGTRKIVDPREVRPGDIIVVGRGQVVPVDGILLSRGLFDTSLVTGEPVPQEVKAREVVYSGYINLGDPVKVRALRSAGESTLQRSVEIAMQLLEKKTSIEKTIERVAPLYTIILFGVSGLALLTLGVRGVVSVLVAGCPSAFILTSSVLSLSTVASMARQGIVGKGGKAVERLSRVKVVVLDKTGTLTLGRPKLTRIIGGDSIPETKLLAYAAALASSSTHPLSRGIVEAVLEREIEIPTAVSVVEVPGSGLKGRVNGDEVKLGKASFAGGEGLVCGEGESSVYVSINGVPGLLCFSDVIEESAYTVIQSMKEMGYKVVLASGDKESNVKRIASRLGVDEWYGGMKPEDKQRLVRELRIREGPVAVVGDGVNDIAALAEADASVAVGDVDVVIEFADAVLRKGISRLPRLLVSSRAFKFGILAGFLVAGIIKIVAITSGSLGLIPLWVVALIGDDGSTVTGIVSGLLTYAFYNRLTYPSRSQ